jgi:hypothetical protein
MGLELGFIGAGDGNRTRTISLGMSAGVRLTSTVAGRWSCWLVREYPRSTPGDLPIGHVAGTPVPSVRTTGNQVGDGRIRSVRGHPRFVAVTGDRLGCCTLVLHVGLLTLKRQIVDSQNPASAVSGWPARLIGSGSMRVAVSLIPIVIACAAFVFSLFTWRERKARDQRDLFLRFHERLIDIDLQRGRRILLQNVHSVEDAEKFVNRALAMFDIAALYVERGYIDRQLFLEEWGYTYAGVWDSGQHFIAERLNRQASNTWSAWPHFQSFGKQAAEWVQRDSKVS